MTNVALLDEKIKASGKKKSHLAAKLGLSRAGFRNLCLGKSEFRTGQVQILCEELNIEDADEKLTIFFA
jgi:methylaspartate ammonia-lyase